MAQTCSCEQTFSGSVRKCSTCTLADEIARQGEASREALEQHAREVAEAAEQQAEAIRAAGERTAAATEQAARDIESALESAASEQRHAIANAHILQSESQTRQGLKLLQAGLYDDSVHHFTKALELNRANLAAHFHLTEAFKALGDNAGAATHLRRCFALLDTAEYCARPGWYSLLVSGLAFVPDMRQAFLATLRKNLPTFGDHGETIALAETLMGSGFVTEGEDVLNALIHRSPGNLRLLLRADAAMRKMGRQADRVRRWCDAVSVETRHTAVAQFAGVVRDWQDSAEVEDVRGRLAEKLEEWKDGLDRGFRQTADDAGAAAANQIGAGGAWGRGFAAFLLAGTYAQPAQLAGMAPILAVLLVIGLVVICGPYSLYARRSRARDNARRAKLADLRSQEAKRWEPFTPVWNHSIPSERPVPSAALLAPGLFVATMLLASIPGMWITPEPAASLGVVSDVRADVGAVGVDSRLAPGGPPRAASAFIDQLDGASAGRPHGVSYVDTPTGRGALFRRQAESRIQYPQIPLRGTLEWVVKIDAGYAYHDGRLTAPSPAALLFTTDCGGGDVTWPGSAWLWLHETGEIQFVMATAKYQNPPAIQVRAPATAFRFDQWHAIGLSYGARGVQIMLDGEGIASSPQAVTLGAGGNHDRPIDLPTIGESVCGAWRNNEHDAGFDGTVDAIRASPRELDWTLARGRPPGTQ